MKYRVFDYVRSEIIKPHVNRYLAVPGFRWFAWLLCWLGILKPANFVDAVKYERIVVKYDKIQELVWSVGGRDPRPLKVLLLGFGAADILMDDIEMREELVFPFPVFGAKVILSPYLPDDAVVPLWDV